MLHKSLVVLTPTLCIVNVADISMSTVPSSEYLVETLDMYSSGIFKGHHLLRISPLYTALPLTVVGKLKGSLNSPSS